jgi:hypothetical protein
VNAAAKRGTSSANGEYVKVPRTEVKVSRGVAPGKNGCSSRSQKPNLAISHFLGHVEKKLPIFFLRFTQEAAKLVEIACIFAGASPGDVVTFISFSSLDLKKRPVDHPAR